MKLSPKTKVDELLTRYPFLKDALIRLDPHFRALDNPLLRKTLGKVATLSKVAMVGGIELNKLLNEMAQEVKKQTGEKIPAVSTGSESLFVLPSYKFEALQKSMVEIMGKTAKGSKQ